MELVNLYNVERQRLAQTTDRHTPLASGQFIVIVHALILNTKGDILIQKRASNKSLWANLWDISCSGAPIAGETSAEGIAREINEELGWSINFDNIRPVLTANFDRGFSDYYVYQLNTPLSISEICYNTREIQAVKWVSITEILALIEKHKFVPYKPSFLQAVLACAKDFTEIDPT
ncbi:NUDIX domain-containing protein [Dolosigranulum savutiense]|uniref:NUDIX domain-containing protein n=1 Tax=Dolosigranulum savutiense TaxID=3110288 RepID=A0AB74TQ85_9LACT